MKGGGGGGGLEWIRQAREGKGCGKPTMYTVYIYCNGVSTGLVENFFVRQVASRSIGARLKLGVEFVSLQSRFSFLHSVIGKKSVRE